MFLIILLISSSFTLATPLQNPAQFSAVVKESEAVFTLPVQARDHWTWRRGDTRDNAMEYRMDVTVKNEGREFTFGFYLWKHKGALPGSGSLKALISTGQKNLFERSESGLMTIVRDANVKVKVQDDQLVITIHGDKDLKRLFSSQPTEVIFKIKYPDEAEVKQIIQVIYQ